MGSRVLVVDDHAGFRTAARALLEAAGFDVVGEAGTADEALTATVLARPDLVLLDVRLPGRDGIDVAAELARLDRPPAVVLISSRPAAVYGDRLRRAPVRGFLAKADLDGAALRRLLDPRAGEPEDRQPDGRPGKLQQ